MSLVHGIGQGMDEMQHAATASNDGAKLLLLANLAPLCSET